MNDSKTIFAQPGEDHPTCLSEHRGGDYFETSRKQIEADQRCHRRRSGSLL